MSKKQSRRFHHYRRIKKIVGPFDIVLCDECRKLGYCRKLRDDHQSTKPIALGWREPLKRPMVFDFRHYSAKVPLRVPVGSRLNEFGRKHLQVAYDAFHQEDFETALISYKCLELGGRYNEHPDYFLALTHFMMEDYRAAAAHMQACIDNTYFSTEDLTPFLEECERRYSHQQSGEQPGFIQGNEGEGSISVLAQKFDSHQF